MADELSGKVVIVTGGSAGIGEAAVQAFAAAGAAVTVADVAEERGAAVTRSVVDGGGRALFVATDVSDDASVANMVDATVSEFGRLDAAFNNAGIEGTPGPLADCPRDVWDRTLAVNLTGVYLCMKAEIPAMLAAGGGSIVNCASIAGLVGFPQVPAYVASKHGVVGLTKAAALELAPQGIRVNAVCPGVIATEMITRTAEEQPELIEQTIAAHPLGRMGRPDEIGATAVWLCTEGSGFVTGQALAVDGGYTTH